MSALKDIKARQIAAAQAAGEQHPYQAGFERKPDTQTATLFDNPLRQIKQAQLSGAANPYQPDAPAARTLPLSSLAHYQAALDADLSSLAALKTLDEKAAAKRVMIETYWPFVADYMDKGHHYPNSIAVWVMVWLFDISDIERALALSTYLVKQGGHIMPPKFDRDMPTFVCDAMYDWASAMLKLEQSASPYLDTLLALIETDKWSLAPMVHSKNAAMLAKHKLRLGDWAQAVTLCELAERVNPAGAGVKKIKQDAEAKLRATEKKS